MVVGSPLSMHHRMVSRQARGAFASEAAVSTSRRVRESARTHSQERALRQEMRRAEQVRMDLDAAGTEVVFQETVYD